MDQTMTISHAAQGRTAQATTNKPAMAALCLAMLLPSLDTSIANSSLPTLAEAFGASFKTVQWVVLAYLAAVTTTIVGAGRLGDRIGRRRLLLGGMALFTAASVACGAAPNIEGLIAARAAQGLGAAVMLAMTMALAGEVAPRARAGTAIGLLGTMSATGTALGPSLGGMLAATVGWRAIFLVSVPLGVVALVMAMRWLPADGPRAARVRGGALGIGGALGLRGDLAEMRQLLREPGLAAGLTMTLLVAMVIMATLVVGPFHLARGLGLGTAQVGFVMSVGPLVAALMGVPAGRLTDRHGAARVTRIGLMAMLVGCLALAVMPVSLGVAGYVGAVGFITAGYALFQASNNTAIMSAVDGGRRGVVAGMLSLARNLGLMAGVGGMGVVFEIGAGTGDVGGAGAEAVVGGMRGVFLVGAVIVMLGAALAGARRRSDAA
jgi:MFS family permease